MSRRRVAAVGLSRFSTEALPAGRRIRSWERHNAQALVGLRVGSPARGTLCAEETNLSLPQLRLARVSAVPHAVVRDEHDIAAAPGRGAVLYLAQEGPGTFAHREGAARIRPGGGILVDADQPFERSFPDGLVELAVWIPRDLLAARLGGSSAGLSRPRILDPDSAEGALGRAAARLAGPALAGQASCWERLEQELTGIAVRLLADGGDAGHLEAVEAWLRRHAPTPGLRAEDVAAGVGLSTRQLSRVLAEDGRSLPEALRGARVQAAHRLLASAEGEALTMAEVAARTGFTSQAQFARAYREVHGVPPLRHRRELRVARF